MAGKIDNFFIVNAPAGSGKTTKIKSLINQLLIDDYRDNILCITYTNRAANELQTDLKTNNVYVYTIHSFLSFFMKPYFSRKEVVNLYFEKYKDQILERIQSKDKKDSNDKYIEKYGELSLNSIENNLKVIYYNESRYNSLYYGGLSHNDLLSFSYLMIQSFPVIRKRLSSKFQHVFIDEYQDTSSDVLNLFYECLIHTKTKLYLLGDRMQQIYSNYDGTFDNRLNQFDSSRKLNINHRSAPQIVDILNKIYNDDNFIQESSENIKRLSTALLPRVIFCDDVDYRVNHIKNDSSDSLILYLSNRARFEKIGCYNLYDNYSKMERYSFNKSYSPVDILINDSVDNPDSLIRLLYILFELIRDYKNKKHGNVIQKIKKNESILGLKNWVIKNHDDKCILNTSLNKTEELLSSSVYLIEDVLNSIKTIYTFNTVYIDSILAEEDYYKVIKTPIKEVSLLFDYLNDPKISTQHGVKGESHDNVVFVADNSKNPTVHMYDFFNVWTEIDFSFTDIQDFYNEYTSSISQVEREVGVEINKLNKDNFTDNENILVTKASDFINKYRDDSLFESLCLGDYKKFINKPNVTNAKKCFKVSTVYGIVSAYKLFYVGCSRARQNLTILVDNNKCNGDMDIDNLKNKFIKIGFQVEEG